jgi:hypothetical protein
MTRLFNAQSIRERTAEFAEQFGPRRPSSDSLAQRCADIIERGDLGCQKDTVKKLVAAIVDVSELPEPTVRNEDSPIKCVVGALVHVANTNQTVLITKLDDDGDGRFVLADGNDNLSDGSSYIHSNFDLKVPTAAQIRRFLRNAGIND